MNLLTQLVKLVFDTPRRIAVWALSRAGANPNYITIAGTLATGVIGGLWAFGYFRAGALALIGVAYFDMLDGSVARATGRITAFGGFLDSTMDRVSDFALFLGPIIFFARLPGYWPVAVFAAMGLFAAQFVSYTRARAEAAGPSPAVGFWQRPERLVAFVMGGFWGTRPARQMPVVLLLMALGCALTALRRMLYTRRALAAADPSKPLELGRLDRLLYWTYDRRSPVYQLTAIALIAACSFFPARYVLWLVGVAD